MGSHLPAPKFCSRMRPPATPRLVTKCSRTWAEYCLSDTHQIPSKQLLDAPDQPAAGNQPDQAFKLMSHSQQCQHDCILRMSGSWRTKMSVSTLIWDFSSPPLVKPAVKCQKSLDKPDHKTEARSIEAENVRIPSSDIINLICTQCCTPRASVWESTLEKNQHLQPIQGLLFWQPDLLPKAATLHGFRSFGVTVQ